MINKLLVKATITAADRKAIAAVRKRVEEISEVERATRPSRESHEVNWRSKLHLQCDAALSELFENPTLAQAEKYHELFIRNEEAKKTTYYIGQACQAGALKESQKLRPIVEAILAEVEAKLDSESSSHRSLLAEAAKNSNFGGDELQIHDGKVKEFRASLAAQRAEAERCPCSWLDMHGLAL